MEKINFIKITSATWSFISEFIVNMTFVKLNYKKIVKQKPITHNSSL